MSSNHEVWHDEPLSDIDTWGELGKRYGLSAAQVRAFEGKRRLARIVEGPNGKLAIFAAPFLYGSDVRTEWLALFMDDERAVTFHGERFHLLNSLHERIVAQRAEQLTPDYVLSVVADVVTESFSPVIDHVDDALDELEDMMMVQPSDEQLNQLFGYKRALSDLRRIVLPTIAMLDGLQDGRYGAVEAKALVYLRDSYTYAWRAHELIDTLRDLLTSALDTYMSVVSNRLNDVMKRLTIVATVFMPISFLAGVGGMNFTRMPFGSDVLFYGLIVLMVIVPLSMVVYFKRKKWL